MTLLDVNDRRGAYPPSWYAATTEPLAPFAPLRGQTRADICVIGGGYTGLSAALHAAQGGLDVVLLDAQRVGFGASGRNGGQVGHGFNQTDAEIARRLGPDAAKALWSLSRDAVALTRHLADQHADGAQYRPGILDAGWRTGDLAKLQDNARFRQTHFGYHDWQILNAEACAEAIGTDVYAGGLLDLGVGHLHPLAYALGLARAARDAGVRIYELSRVKHITFGQPARVETGQGQITADFVIHATNGYGTRLLAPTRAAVMPINNFMVATAPLNDPKRILRDGIAVADSKFVVNYFRKSEDNRLLFGGGETYHDRFPADIARRVRKALRRVFPALSDVAIDYAWGGTLAVTTSRLPHLCRPAPNVLSAAGYSGHGVALATLSGKVMALACLGDDREFARLERLPTGRFPGGDLLRSPILALAMGWYAMRDRLGV